MARRTTAVSTATAQLVGPGQLKVLNGHLAFKAHGEGPLRLDPTTLKDVYCYGDVSISGAAMEMLFRHGIQTAWLSPAGARCRGRLMQTNRGTTITRIRQHRVLSQPDHRRDWAKRCVDGKIDSMIAAARHYQRHGQATAGPLMEMLRETQSRITTTEAVEVVRGFEGAASAAWFNFFGTLILPPWAFATRNRRPPTDPVNAVLSLAYTWLLNRTIARAEAQGFETNLGGLHEYHPGRPSLACDLIEPLRVPAVDRWVVAMLAQNELSTRDFRTDENGGIRLQPAAFAKTLYLWEQHNADLRLEVELDSSLRDLSKFLIARDSRPMTEPTADDL